MDFYNVLNLLCGLAFFLFGMQVMMSEPMAGGGGGPVGGGPGM